MKGMVYFPVGAGGDAQPEVFWTLQNVFAPNGINWIRLHMELCTMDSVKTTQIHCDNQGAMSETEYKWLVKQAHSLGLRVMSEHLMSNRDPEGYWGGDIGKFYNEKQWDEWFASYETAILHFASLSEEAGVDYMIMVSELDSTTGREKQWRDLIAKVRNVYHGKLSMAFDTEQAIQKVKFWDALDAIGVHPYYLEIKTLTDPTPDQLAKAYAPYMDRLAALSKQYGKPVIFTEIGFESDDKRSRGYINNFQYHKIDVLEQRDIYQALVRSIQGKDWVDGTFFYTTYGSPNYAEPWNYDYSFVEKPADDVVRAYYGAAPRATATPVVYPTGELKTSLNIYTDQLDPTWKYYPPEGIDMGQTAVAISGKAIQAKLYNFNAIDLSSPAINFADYQWLEFDLYVVPNGLPKFYSVGVLLRDTHYYPSPFRLELFQSQFIEGGGIQPGKWQHVRIPLNVFGPLMGEYNDISIDQPGHLNPNQPIVIYLDNIVLRGK